MKAENPESLPSYTKLPEKTDLDVPYMDPADLMRGAKVRRRFDDLDAAIRKCLVDQGKAEPDPGLDSLESGLVEPEATDPTIEFDH